ncbi:MAG TPA: DUF1501 domain-containing protein, partial [Planctomycetota bacterium]|nr:DUF1501 domain-containing protein [Planctomycetota bacterium]
MLTILGGNEGADRFCDGLARRSFLKIGGLGLGASLLSGVSLPDLLRAEAKQGVRNSHKALIQIFLPGGPPHQDMWDLKPDAPREIRGEFRPIDTNVSGIQICELFPRLARRMDRVAIVRSIVGATGDHYAFQCQTGRSHRNQPPGGWPSFGSTVAKLFGPGGRPGARVPAFVGLAPPMGEMRWADNGQPGFLGPAFAPFRPHGEGRDDMTLDGISLERLRDRERLLASFDRFRREADATGLMEGMDSFQEQAFGILTSSRLADALDLDREPTHVRDRYGRGSPKNQYDGGPKLLDQFLLARRLVEAGVRVVTLAFSRWDWHGNNF